MSRGQDITDIPISSLRELSKSLDWNAVYHIDQYYNELLGQVKLLFKGPDQSLPEKLSFSQLEDLAKDLKINIKNILSRQAWIHSLQKGLYEESFIDENGILQEDLPLINKNFLKTDKVLPEEVKRVFTADVDLQDLVNIIDSYIPDEKQLLKNLSELSKDICTPSRVSHKFATKGFIQHNRTSEDICLINLDGDLEYKYLVRYTEEELDTPVMYGINRIFLGRKITEVGRENEVLTFGNLLDEISNLTYRFDIYLTPNFEHDEFDSGDILEDYLCGIAIVDKNEVRDVGPIVNEYYNTMWLPQVECPRE